MSNTFLVKKFNITTLEAICSRISSGGTPSRARPDYFTTNGDGHLWVKSKELLDSSVDDTEEKISDEAIRNSSVKYYPANTVLMAMYGANVCQLGWLRRPATVNQAVCGMVVNETVADSRYVFYALLQERGELAARARGAAQQNLNLDLIRNFEIPLPDLPTQRKIAAILSAYDDLIENNTRRIKILEEMAQMIYREWFVHFRFPGHEKVRMVDSPLGKIPEKWEVSKIEDLYNTASGGTPSRKIDEYFNGSINWIKTQELQDGFVFETDEKITETGLQNSSAKVFPVNSIIIAMYGATIGKLGILAQPASTNQACCALLQKDKEFGHTYGFLTLLERRKDIIGLRMGAAQQNISQVVIKNFQILNPNEQILEYFNDIVNPMFDLIRDLQRKNQILRRTRDLLLPKLISGEVEVEDIEVRVSSGEMG